MSKSSFRGSRKADETDGKPADQADSAATEDKTADNRVETAAQPDETPDPVKQESINRADKRLKDGLAAEERLRRQQEEAESAKADEKAKS